MPPTRRLPAMRDARARLADAEAATEAARERSATRCAGGFAQNTNADLHQMQLRASAEALP